MGLVICAMLRKQHKHNISQIIVVVVVVVVVVIVHIIQRFTEHTSRVNQKLNAGSH